MTLSSPTPRIEAPELAPLAGIRHGFFTRRGGVSGGLYESLNCGVGSNDSKELVAQNRARVAWALGVAADRLATPYQLHSAEAVAVREAWPADDRPKADAVITDRPGIAVGIGTADCGPVLFADLQAGVVGAAHAGWRGALSGVLDAAMASMERLGARRERIVAVLGPTISVDSYEVDDGFRRHFEAADGSNAAFFLPGSRAGHHQFDLPAYVVNRLQGLGAGTVRDLARCTYREEADFFSFRRTTHRREQDYGRQLSVIVLADRE